MYHQLATRFGRNAHQISGREPLDNEALYRHVPSIFAREAHDSRSERYVYVPTIDIVEGLRREGWFPFFAVQSVPRDGSRHGHAKHMLRLRRDEGIGKPEAAEVIIVNSHDGTSAYQMFAGMLRFVCTNSMIAGERFEEVRVPHKGNIEHDIIEGVFTVAEDFPRLLDASESMKAIQLSPDEQRLLGEVSLVARYGVDESPVRPEQIIEPRRRELWRGRREVADAAAHFVTAARGDLLAHGAPEAEGVEVGRGRAGSELEGQRLHGKGSHARAGSWSRDANEGRVARGRKADRGSTGASAKRRWPRMSSWQEVCSSSLVLPAWKGTFRACILSTAVG